METSGRVDAVCHSSESELNTTSANLSLNEVTKSELNSSETMTSAENTKDVEKTIIPSIRPSFEIRDLADKEVVADKRSATAPGKLEAREIGSCSILLEWEKPSDRGVTYYEIMFKTKTETAWSTPIVSDFDEPCHQLTGLVPDTEYVFKVRAHYQDKEGDYSEQSDPYKTKPMVVEMTSPILKHPTRKPRKEKNAFKVRAHFQEDKGDFSDVSDNITTLDKEAHLDADDNSIGLEQQHRLKRSVDTSDESTAVTAVNVTPTKKRRDSRQTSSRQPGRPSGSDVGSDYVLLGWASPETEDVRYYEIKYRSMQDEMWCKDSVTTNDSSPDIFVRGLLQDTEYAFKVRAHYRDGEGVFSEQSDAIQTTKSPALSVRDASIKLQDGEPAFYKLPLTENEDARNTKYKTRKCELGSSDTLRQEKTIMMIGATGSGKSTLIDGMVNHLLGVKWEDDFRFKIIDLMTDEEARKGLETESQTNWITSYRVHPITNNVRFVCNIIDTPGFGDTRGIKRDHQLVDQIRAFFDTKGVQGIETIDAICFVTQAPLPRLTHAQRYIYDSILSIFGNDMKENIVAMITFADGKEPPVINALKQAEVPTKQHFVFNNSALFEPNTPGKCNRFGKMFWEMGVLSYDGFFNFLSNMKTQSLQLTAEVLLKREQLNTTVEGLLPQIDMGLVELATMKTERDLMDKYEREIADNKNFTYEVDEYRQKKVSLNLGTYVTNCTFCHYTCHANCVYDDDADKEHCSAMSNGVCRVCPRKCRWDSHRNNDFRIEVTVVKVSKSYEEMKKKLEIAKEEKVSKENLIRRLGSKWMALKDTVSKMIGTVRDCGNYLRKNAIKANPLTELEYLDVLIQSAQQQKKPGFIDRVKELNILKRGAEVKAKSVDMTPEEYMKEMGFLEM